MGTEIWTIDGQWARFGTIMVLTSHKKINIYLLVVLRLTPEYSTSYLNRKTLHKLKRKKILYTLRI